MVDLTVDAVPRRRAARGGMVDLTVEVVDLTEETIHLE